MLPVSARFLSALSKPQKRVTTATLTMPGEEPVTVRVKSGRLDAGQGRTVHRRLTANLYATSETARNIERDGATLQVSHGLSFSGSLELITVFTGEVLRAAQPFGDRTVAVTAVDFGHWVNEARFISPRSISGGRAAAIEALVTEARPETTVIDQSLNGGMSLGAVWPRSRSDAVNELARDGNLESFFRGDGSYLIRDAKTLQSLADYTVKGGPGGTLKGGARLRPLDRRYNAVVVMPATSEQTWTQQVAIVDDPGNPRHPDRIGTRPYFYASPSIATAEHALAVATQMLDRVLGNTQTVQFSAVSNPALEEGDVVRAVVPSLNGEPAAIYQHFIDSFSLDLVSGDMTAETRSQAVTDE